jgi:hypothetical protein
MSAPSYRKLTLANYAQSGSGPVFGSTVDSECEIRSPADVSLIAATGSAVHLGTSYESGLDVADVAGSVSLTLAAGGTLSLPAFSVSDITLNGTSLSTRVNGLETDVASHGTSILAAASAASAAQADANSALSAATTAASDAASASTQASTVAGNLVITQGDVSALALRIAALESAVQA